MKVLKNRIYKHFKGKEEILDVLISNLEDYYNEKGVPLRGGTMQDAISASLLLQALAGNIAAYTTIRDTMGYKPAENVKNDVTIKIDMPDRVRELGE